MINKTEIFRKIGGILAELNEQYQYIAENPGNFNELELELFLANADFLSEHTKILMKLALAGPEQPAGLLPPAEEQHALPQATQRVVVTSPPPPAAEKQAGIYGAGEPVRAEERIEEKPKTGEYKFEEPEFTGFGSAELKAEVPKSGEPKTTEPEGFRKAESAEPGREPEVKPAPEIRIIPEVNITSEEKITPEAKVTPEAKAAPEIRQPGTTAPLPEAARPVHETRPAHEAWHTQAARPSQETERQSVREAPAHVPTINDLISEQQSQSRQPAGGHYPPKQVTDLKAIISLNDKLLFIKDLFNGYSLAYSEAIEILNRFDSFEAADHFLQSNYAAKNNWASKQASADKLYAVLHRKFD